MIQGQLDFCERQRSLQTHRAILLRNGWLPETRLVDSQVPHWNGSRGLGSWEMCEEDLTPPRPFPSADGITVVVACYLVLCPWVGHTLLCCACHVHQ